MYAFVEGAVGVVEVDPEADALGQPVPVLDVAEHRLAAAGVELGDPVGLDLSLRGDAQLALDLELHRQAVAVPAALARHLVAPHRAVAGVDVLEDAGEHVVRVRHARSRSAAPRRSSRPRRPRAARASAGEHVVLLPALEDPLLERRGRTAAGRLAGSRARRMILAARARRPRRALRTIDAMLRRSSPWSPRCLAGCGSDAEPATPAACLDGPDAYVEALEARPARSRSTAPPISECLVRGAGRWSARRGGRPMIAAARSSTRSARGPPGRCAGAAGLPRRRRRRPSRGDGRHPPGPGLQPRGGGDVHPGDEVRSRPASSSATRRASRGPAAGRSNRVACSRFHERIRGGPRQTELWGGETAKAVENFPVSGQPDPGSGRPLARAPQGGGRAGQRRAGSARRRHRRADRRRGRRGGRRRARRAVPDRRLPDRLRAPRRT